MVKKKSEQDFFSNLNFRKESASKLTLLQMYYTADEDEIEVTQKVLRQLPSITLDAEGAI